MSDLMRHLELMAAINELPGLRLRGLMTIPAATTNQTAQREPFRQLRELMNQLSDSLLSSTPCRWVCREIWRLLSARARTSFVSAQIFLGRGIIKLVCDGYPPSHVI